MSGCRIKSQQLKSEKRKYRDTWFPVEILKEASDVFDAKTKVAPDDRTDLYLSVTLDSIDRGHDDEIEFYADYRKGPTEAYFRRTTFTKEAPNTFLCVQTYGLSDRWAALTNVEVHADTWSTVLAVMEVFERAKEDCHLSLGRSALSQPVVFIGHGNSGAWKLLRDHLRDKHDFNIEAYEVGARAGHAVRDILEGMLEESSMAFLIMTGEDMTTAGELHPRLNVVHEAGLFQGRIGFHRAIICLEEGTAQFSNIHGVEQIRFTNIREVFGDVVATIRREFPKA